MTTNNFELKKKKKRKVTRELFKRIRENKHSYKDNTSCSGPNLMSVSDFQSLNTFELSPQTNTKKPYKNLLLHNPCLGYV